MEKEKAKLKVSDYIDILRGKPGFSVAFPLIVMTLLFVLFGILTDGDFLSSNTLLIVFNQGLVIATVAIGVSFIYTTGNIDISVGNAMALAATLGALVYNYTENAVFMIATAVCAGMMLMLFNSTMSVIFHIKSITVAVVMIQLYSAVVSKILGANSLKVDYSMAKGLENDGFRYLAFILYFIVCYLLFHHTALGRTLRMIGGNENCAKQSGMDARTATIIGFVMAGVGIGLGATFSIIRTGSVSVATGEGMGMNVMMATVLGGMSIFGGSKSNVYAGVLGAMTVSLLNSGMLMIGIPTAIIQGVRGIIFLLLVFLNSERLNTLPSKQQV